MKHLPSNTLAHHALLPQLRMMDLTAIKCSSFSKSIVNYRNTKVGQNTPVPDAEAVQFYLFNHLASLVKKRFSLHEPLPKWADDVMKMYKYVLVAQGIRMTSYTALIVVRESRHLHTQTEQWWQEKIIVPYGSACVDFHNSIKGSGSGTAVSKFQTNPPDTTIGHLFNSIETIFFKGKFSGGYGGKPWGEIAKTLNQFFKGNTSQEMMVDTAYTLAHNNGPMFNKGMLYGGYTDKFKMILDIQRGGQVPEYIIENNAYGLYLTSDQVSVFKAAQAECSKDIGTYVDYFKVEQLGALGNYKSQQQKQLQKYGGKTSDFASHTHSGTTSQGPTTGVPSSTGSFVIMPGVAVPIYQRMKAA